LYISNRLEIFLGYQLHQVSVLNWHFEDRQYRHLMQLIAQEDFIKFSHHKSSRTCIIKQTVFLVFQIEKHFSFSAHKISNAILLLPFSHHFMYWVLGNLLSRKISTHISECAHFLFVSRIIHSKCDFQPLYCKLHTAIVY
jgi:hypothetical protein